MNRAKLLGMVSIGLLAVNLVWVYFWVAHQPPHHRHDKPKQVIIDQLGLDEQQTKAYEELIDGHRSSIHQSDQQIAALKDQLYLTLKGDEKKHETDSLIAEIGKVHLKIERIHYDHFLDIKRLCRPEQLKAFDALTSKLSKLFSPPPHPKDEKH
jgi:hypothetical protein